MQTLIVVVAMALSVEHSTHALTVVYHTGNVSVLLSGVLRTPAVLAEDVLSPFVPVAPKCVGVECIEEGGN